MAAFVRLAADKDAKSILRSGILQGFAAFGRVVKGMDVVKKIQAAPAKEQNLDPPVKIIQVRKKP